MGLLKGLTSKPWEHQGLDASVTAGDIGTAVMPPQRIALRTFLGVVAVLFGLFITAYFVRMELDDWGPLPEPTLLWINTLVLFICSFVLYSTRNAIINENRKQVKLGMLAGGILTLGFVYGQFSAWSELNQAGYYVNGNPANSFFFVLTGLHALHILGGLWVWTRSSIRVWFGGNLKEARLSVELCATYWHFLLLVWLVLFALLSYT